MWSLDVSQPYGPSRPATGIDLPSLEDAEHTSPGLPDFVHNLEYKVSHKAGYVSLIRNMTARYAYEQSQMSSNSNILLQRLIRISQELYERYVVT
jgi:hypothetical protein